MDKANTLWTTADEAHLIMLRDTHKSSWESITTILSRTVPDCQNRYYALKQSSASSLVTWTPKIDHVIIDARRRGLSIKQLSAELGLWAPAVTERWAWLQRNEKVPEDVLALYRRKEEVTFTTEEDEWIVKKFIGGMDDEQIYKQGAWKGKSMGDLAKRRRQLTNEGASGGLYVKKLGVGEKKETALDKAMGKKKFKWMK